METDPYLNLTDEDLVSMFQQGERRAFDMLVLRYMQKAYRIALDFTHDCEEARDLSQEAFLRAFSRIKDFDKRSSFYTWFYRILVNLCLDHNRRKGRILWERIDAKSACSSKQSEVADISSSPDQEAIAEETKRRVGMALDALPKKQRTAFLLRNHQGLSIPEIAEVMKTAEGTVRVHLHRAVLALKESLAELA